MLLSAQDYFEEGPEYGVYLAKNIRGKPLGPLFMHEYYDCIAYDYVWPIPLKRQRLHHIGYSFVVYPFCSMTKYCSVYYRNSLCAKNIHAVGRKYEFWFPQEKQNRRCVIL